MFFTFGQDADVITANIQSVRVANNAQTLIVILHQTGWGHLRACIVENDFNRGELKVREEFNDLW